MSTRRVLFVDPWGELGGAEVVVDQLARRLAAHGYEAIVVSLHPGPWIDDLRDAGIDALALDAGRTRQPHRQAGAVARLRRLVRERRADVLHANGGSMLLYAALAAGGRPVVWHVHDPIVQRDLFASAFVAVERRMRPSWTVFANESVAREHPRRFPNCTPSSVITPGIDPEALGGGDAGSARARFGIPDGAPVVLSLARIQRHKGQHHLVAALPAVLARHPEARLVLAGGTLFGMGEDYVSELRAGAAALGVEGRVVLTGFVDDGTRRDLLAAADVFAHTADFEPFGISVLEASAAGIPAVVTDADGPTSLVEDGCTGLVVPRGDTEALAGAICRLLDDPGTRRAMGAAGRVAASRHSVETMVAATAAVYDEVLGRRS